MCICLSGSLVSLLPTLRAPPPPLAHTLSKKFAIDHHSSLNCFANCFQQYSPPPPALLLLLHHLLITLSLPLSFSLHFLLARADKPLPVAPPLPSPLPPLLLLQPHPLAEQRAARQRRFLLRCQNLMNFFFIHLGLSHSRSGPHPYPHSHSSSYCSLPSSLLETLPRDFVLFILLFTLLSQLGRPSCCCCCCCCPCCVSQHFSNQSAPLSAPPPLLWRPFLRSSLHSTSI